MSVCCMHQHVNVPGTIWCTQCESLIAGVRFDDYTVTSYLGQGSFGAIYLAQQHSLNKRTVVLKMSQGSWSREAVVAFRQEAAILASLSHPYILPIHAYGLLHALQRDRSNYLPYVVLPYAEQGSLEDMLVHGHVGTLPLKRVLAIVEEIADALDYAHTRGVLHRDVKPANVLLMGSHVMLSDFGVAALIDVETSHVRTSLAGSPAFMAPEVWRFCPGRYSDQYALAVTCFRLLTGKYPWQNSEGRVKQWAHLHSFVPPRSLPDYCPELPTGVDLVLQRALAKDPHERYLSVGAFASALRAAENDTQIYFIPPRPQIPPQVQSQPVMEEQPQVMAVANPTPPPVMEKQPQVMAVANPMPPVVEEQPQVMVVASPTPPPIAVANRPAPIEAQVQALVASEQEVYANTITANESWPLAQEEEQEYLDGQTELLVTRSNRWVPLAFALNLFVCLLFVAQAAFMREQISTLLYLFLALSPSLCVGPLVAFGFRRLPHSTLAWGVLWGLLFAVCDTLLSTLFCYGGTALVLTFLQWGHQWQHSGDGIGIFLESLGHLGPRALLLAIIGLWVTAVGGVCIGMFSARAAKAKPTDHRR